MSTIKSQKNCSGKDCKNVTTQKTKKKSKSRTTHVGMFSFLDKYSDNLTGLIVGLIVGAIVGAGFFFGMWLGVVLPFWYIANPTFFLDIIGLIAIVLFACFAVIGFLRGAT